MSHHDGGFLTHWGFGFGHWSLGFLFWIVVLILLFLFLKSITKNK